MKSKKTLSVIIVLTIFATIVVFFVISKSSSSLVSPATKQDKVQQPSSQPSAQSVTPAYNPPKEIKYGSSTDLQKELESVNPQVLDSDF